MKYIILAAIALIGLACSSHSQTIKSLGYDTTNGRVIYGGTNALTFTNPLQFESGVRAATRTNLGGTTVGNAVFTATNAATAATTIGLGTTNSPTFSNLTLNGTLGVSNAATFATNVTVNGNISVGSLTTTTPSTWALDATQTAAATNGILALPSNANVIRLTNNTAISGVSGGVLGAFYYLVNQTTNAVTISNVGGITVQGGTSLTLGANQAATLVATGATNASVASRGDLTDVALGGTLNTAPSQTNASSASSLMTRDLVGQEFANPRNRMQTTYWFGLEGLGQWGAVGQNATTSYLSARESSGVGGGQLIYSAAGIGVSAAGAGLRLGSADPYGALGIFTIAGSGDTTFKARLLKNTQAGLGPAMAFVMGTRTATTIWQNNAPGIYYVPQPTNAWASNAVVTNNYRIAVSNVVFAVSTAGTNDATQPAWPDAINAVVTNGSAVYRNVGPHTSNNWVLAIGSTNASQVAMTNTGKVGPTSTARASYVLTFRVNGTTNVFAKVETGTANGNAASESAEVSLGAPATTSDFQPQVWSRDDVAGGGSVDPAVRYISVDGPLGNLQ